MVKTVTPFSTRAREGATDSPLGDYVDVDQAITSIASAGFYDENGKLTGNVSTDRAFTVDPTHVGIPNGATVISPQLGEHPYIDMSGYSTLQIAIKPTNAGSYTMTAVMGPETHSYANLTPASPANTLKGQGDWYASSDFETLSSATETLTADYWNIFTIINRLKDQKLLQFKITNASGGNSDIIFASMRVV